jgi:hypothetical protein
MPAGQRVPTILVAGTPQAVDIASRALGTRFEYRRAYSVAEALALADSGVDCVLCNVSFDESHMFEFLAGLRARKDLSAKPVVCFRILPFSENARAAVDLALKAVGSTVFVDFYQIAESAGMPAAYEALRQAVDMSVQP